MSAHWPPPPWTMWMSLVAAMAVLATHAIHIAQAHDALDHGSLDDDGVTAMGSEVSGVDLDRAKWAAAGNWAAAIGMTPLRHVVVPVRLNLVLIGFEGHSTAMPIDFTADDVLYSYLENVESVLPHAFVHLKPDVTVANSDQPATSIVQYSYRVHVTSLSHTVGSVFDAAINTFLRRDNYTTSGAHYQVDTDRLWPLYESLLHALDMADSYSLVILNPLKAIRTHLRYGYRSGFSAEEMHAMYNDNALRKLILQINSADDKGKEQNVSSNFMPPHDGDHEATLPAERARPMAMDKVVYEETTALADEWARDFLKQNQMLMVERLSTSNLAPSKEDCTTPMTVMITDAHDSKHSRGHTINMKPAYTLAEAADTVINVGAPQEVGLLKYIASGGTAYPACAVDSSVGHGRAAFVDLMAGPFTWGSLDQSSIIDTAAVYPNVMTTFVDAMARYRWSQATIKGESDREGRGNNEEVPKRNLLQYDSSSNSDWTRKSDNQPVESAFYDELRDLDDIGTNSLQAELIIYESFERTRCDPTREMDERQQSSCDEARRKIREIKEALRSMNNGAQPPNDRVVNSGISGVVTEEADVGSTGGAQFDNDRHVHTANPNNPDILETDRAGSSDTTLDETRKVFLQARETLLTRRNHIKSAVEDFGSRLGNMVSRTFRTLITPPTARPPVGVYSLSKRLAFNIYLVRNHHGRYMNLGALSGGFDFDLFKTQIGKLQLPDQSFTFSLQELALTDDPELALTYWSALHTAQLETPTLNGTTVMGPHTAMPSRLIRRMYLDSSHLRERLTRIEQARTNDGILTKIAIFVFSVDHEYPVFIDLNRQAAAIDHVIVSVQNSQTRFVTNDVCNAHNVVVNLRNPTKAIIAATAQARFVIGGILPAHITVEPQGIISDYLWSVGNGPNTITSPYARFSAVHVDLAHRHWMAVRLDWAAQTINAIMTRLHGVSTRVYANKIATRLSGLYDAIVRKLDTISDHAAVMDYRTIYRLLDEIEQDLRLLDSTTTTLEDRLHHSQCQATHIALSSLSSASDLQQIIDSVIWLLWLVVINLILGGIVLLIRRQGPLLRSKVKVN